MARVHLDPPLAARAGGALESISVDRISTKNQDPKSNEDQRALIRNWVIDRYGEVVNWTEITGQGSGERTDRSQVRELEELIESGRYDLVIMEDLGRHMRRSRAVDLCELCEDNDTRLIAINDGIDTAKDWRLHAFFAAFKHEQSNKDTSSRIKRTLGNRFCNGGVLQTFVYGINKPPGAKSDSELTKDPAAETIYDEWFDRLEKGASYSEIADWLNATNVPVGPWSRRKKWDCAMVGRVTHNPILKGLRVRNRRKSKRVNKTGKYVSVKAAPEELLTRECPHLAFIEPERYDRVIRLLEERNKKFSRNKNGRDPLANRPRKRTRWPGQHLHCGICGRKLVYGGHGQAHHLQCDGTRQYHCWQSFTVDGPLAALKMSAAIFDEICAAGIR